MKALLVRVGIDCTPVSGGWRAPVNLKTNEFAYVPILECAERQIELKYRRSYEEFFEPCKRLGKCLPSEFTSKTPHLDPDFSKLTYGDIDAVDDVKPICSGKNNHKGKPLLDLQKDDLLVFYAGLDPGRWKNPKIELVYAIIGLYVIKETPRRATKIPNIDKYRDNYAHTKGKYNKTDILVSAKPAPLSGRLEKCIQIGERKNGRYWLQQNLFDKWGDFVRSSGLPFSELYLQRSTLFRFKNAEKFYKWFMNQKIQLVERNN